MDTEYIDHPRQRVLDTVFFLGRFSVVTLRNAAWPPSVAGARFSVALPASVGQTVHSVPLSAAVPVVDLLVGSTRHLPWKAPMDAAAVDCESCASNLFCRKCSYHRGLGRNFRKW